MTILELMTGTHPFAHIVRDFSVCQAIVDGIVPQPPSTVFTGKLDQEIWRLLSSCWSRDPQSRRSMLEVKEVLKRLERIPRGAPADDLDRSSSRRQASEQRSSPVARQPPASLEVPSPTRSASYGPRSPSAPDTSKSSISTWSTTSGSAESSMQPVYMRQPCRRDDIHHADSAEHHGYTRSSTLQSSGPAAAGAPTPAPAIARDFSSAFAQSGLSGRGFGVPNVSRLAAPVPSESIQRQYRTIAATSPTKTRPALPAFSHTQSIDTGSSAHEGRRNSTSHKWFGTLPSRRTGSPEPVQESQHGHGLRSRSESVMTGSDATTIADPRVAPTRKKGLLSKLGSLRKPKEPGSRNTSSPAPVRVEHRKVFGKPLADVLTYAGLSVPAVVKETDL